MKPLAVDLFCGLGGWAEGLLAAGWEVIGFDIERHACGPHRYPAQLVLQDVLTLHGSQFREADLIVASPPCQAYSYQAMPWKLAKALPPPDNTLFEACFRIQREACEAAGRHIPMIVENVRGAQKWVGRARWRYGSFYLWGDVPALMPLTTHTKVSGIMWSRYGRDDYVPSGFTQVAAERLVGIKQHGSGESWWDKALDERRKAAPSIKVGGGRDGWFRGNDNPMRRGHPVGTKRRAASALVAKIPFPLAHHIGRVFLPRMAA